MVRNWINKYFSMQMKTQLQTTSSKHTCLQLISLCSFIILVLHIYMTHNHLLGSYCDIISIYKWSRNIANKFCYSTEMTIRIVKSKNNYSKPRSLITRMIYRLKILEWQLVRLDPVVRVLHVSMSFQVYVYMFVSGYIILCLIKLIMENINTV